MGITTAVGLIVGIGAVLMSVLMDGGDLAGFLSPSAALIVFGGTIGATITSFPLPVVKQLPSLLRTALVGDRASMSTKEMIALFVSLAEKARREGLLSLEDEAGRIRDSFVRKGMLLVVDGIDPEAVRAILEVDIAAVETRHQKGYGMLEAMGGYSPTMGIIGTVMGLVHVLSNLEDPSSLGPAIAVAFIATFYGVASANLLWLPFAARLRSQSKQEVWWKEVAREGILAIQSGDNPRIISEKMESFLSTNERSQLADKGASASPARGAAKPVPSAARAQS